jgi:ribosomal protein L35
MKTNKSYTKRIKVTKKGKVLARKPGQNHFNARQTRARQLEGKKPSSVTITNKSKSRFLSN